MQHAVGMKGSKYIVAINKDRDAPMMRMADLGVVGDAVRLVPEINAKIAALRGS